MKRLQNQIAESRYTLTVAALYGLVIWLLSGLLQQHWWVQFACFVLSTYLMVELNNGNALIRIYSRTVSAFFIVLTGVACYLFPSMEGAIAMLCAVASLLTMFHAYQDKEATGWVFYTFMCLGLASLVMVHIVWFVPVYWLLLAFFLYALSWRTFFASVLGLLLPYWFMGTWVLWHYEGDFSALTSHFAPLTQFSFGEMPLDVCHILTFAYIVVLAVTGTIHYLRTSYHDNIRIRQLFYSFIMLDVVSAAFLIAQPQHFDLLIRMMIIVTSPLIAHFVSLTHTRLTNIAFYVICGAALILTAFHLWSSSFIF